MPINDRNNIYSALNIIGICVHPHKIDHYVSSLQHIGIYSPIMIKKGMNSLQLQTIIIKVKVNCIIIDSSLALFINDGSQIGPGKWPGATIISLNKGRQNPTMSMLSM